jgi:hypothetical protein
LEETGIKAKVVDLLMIREWDELYWGRPDLYFVFLMKSNQNI